MRSGSVELQGISAVSMQSQTTGVRILLCRVVIDEVERWENVPMMVFKQHLPCNLKP
jgi:hypothetical protein